MSACSRPCTWVLQLECLRGSLQILMKTSTGSSLLQQHADLCEYVDELLQSASCASGGRQIFVKTLTGQEVLLHGPRNTFGCHFRVLRHQLRHLLHLGVKIGRNRERLALPPAREDDTHKSGSVFDSFPPPFVLNQHRTLAIFFSAVFGALLGSKYTF